MTKHDLSPNSYLLTTIYYILTTITIKSMGFSPEKDKILKSFHPTNPSSDIFFVPSLRT
ncbi:MAG: hypothetical protein QMD02_01650 [Bacteroidales bacterium]|nr:hypothetical protein [Bacteroidales bacterium]